MISRSPSPAQMFDASVVNDDWLNSDFGNRDAETDAEDKPQLILDVFLAFLPGAVCACL